MIHECKAPKPNDVIIERMYYQIFLIKIYPKGCLK